MKIRLVSDSALKTLSARNTLMEKPMHIVGGNEMLACAAMFFCFAVLCFG